MAKKIMKMKMLQLQNLINGVYVPYTSSYRTDVENKLTTGSMRVSLRIGKRRKLYRIRIVECDYIPSHSSSGLVLLKAVAD